MFRIRWDFIDIHFSDMAGIVILDILDAIINVIGCALGEHLDRTVRQVADESGELMSIGHPVSGKPKTDALDSPGKEHNVSLDGLGHSRSLLSLARASI